MKNLVSTYVEQFRQDRQKQIRLVAILAALAVVVAGVVFWQLHNTGVAMTNEVFCGQEEHTHTDACYSKVLTCGLEETEGETGHVHTDACYDEDGALICGLTESEGTEAHVHCDACYETVLTCGIPEHTHTVECLIDETADVETADMWESTLPEELSGSWAEDVVAVAKSQVGYTESEQNFQLAEDGETRQGYTRYGAWYGNEYGDWDAMFVSFCLNYADVPESEIPENSGAYALSAAVHEAGLYIDSEAFTPNAGDLVFFDEDADGHADRVGIIADIDDDGELTVIEGNFEDAVAENDYGSDDETILAYGILPEQEDESEEQEYDRAESVILSTEEPEEEEEENAVESIAAAAAIDATEISTYEALYNAVNGKTGEIDIALAADMNATTSHITLASGADVTINLNGYTLAANDSEETALFTVPEEASLTIKDSQAKTPKKGDGFAVSAAYAGETAEVVSDNGTVTLTYYVTESEVTDSAAGYTTETRYPYTVESSGMISTTGKHALFSVEGGKLNIESGFFFGGNTETSSRAIDASDLGTVNISGGYICGFVEGYTSTHGETVDGGAVRVSGSVQSGEDTISTTLNISGDAVLAGNKAATGGAVDVADGAVLYMTGGVISGNEALESVGTSELNNDYGGGGIHIYNATAEISGGYVTNNKADCTGYFDGGGGILVYGSTLRFTGGYITGNYAASSGGGIRTSYASDNARGTTDLSAAAGNVYITGGFICANYAASAEGGGVCIDNGGTCAVVAINGSIYLNNNETATDQHWGGGGLFCANGATTYMQDILVTDNDAGGYGGGVAGCSTGRIAIAEGAGAAIYDNTAAGTHLSGTESAKNDDHTYAEMNKIFNEYGYQDYFCALESQISGMMLGGYPANWTGSADGEAISNVGIYDVLHAAYIMGLTAHPSTEAREAAQDAATVYITGNSSSTHGGGVLANGYLLIGTVVEFEIPDALELNADKAFINSETGQEEPIEEGQFTFTVTNELDAVVAIGTVDETGAINFDRRLAFDAAGTYTFTIREDYDSIGSVIPDTTEYTLVVTVGETERSVEIPDQEMLVRYYFYNITHYTLYKDGEVAFDRNVTSEEDSIVHMTMPSYTFTNYTADEIAITVNKVWTDDGEWPDNIDEINVDLIRNGEVIDTATLTENNPSYTWEDLPTSDNGEEYTYEVKEQNVSGYVSSQVITSSSSGGDKSYWVPLSETDDPSLYVGGQYLIVYNDGSNSVTLGQDSSRIDEPFVTDDSIPIDVNTGGLSFGGETYSSYISDADVQSLNSRNIIWTAVSSTKTDDGTMLKNQNLDSWILIQDYLGTSGNHLKGTTSTEYASPIWMAQVGNSYYLQGWDGFDETENYRYITYESGKFTSNTSTANAATVYVKVTPITDSTTVTISNTHVYEAVFSLNVLKVKGGDSNITLPGATFELYLEGEEDTPLHFELTGDSTYKYLADYDDDDDAKTDLVTGSWGRFVVTDLPAGTYILHETVAPDGYQCADDIEIKLDENTEGTTVYLEVEDPTYPVNILKFTGSGMGTATVENDGTYYLWREDSSGNLERAISFESDGSYSYSNIVWGTSSDEDGAITVTGTQTELKFEGLLSGYTYYLTTSPEDPTTGYTPVEVTYENYLTGAEFMISKTVTEIIDGVETPVTYYACFSYEVADPEKEGSVDTYKFHAWVTDPDDEEYSDYTFVLTSGSEGYIHIEGMDIGRYLLTETKAPEGYNMLAEPVYFTIERDNVATTAVKIGDYTIGVENYAAGELPNTGGLGTWIYTAIGVLLIGGAASLLVYRKRRAVRS